MKIVSGQEMAEIDRRTIAEFGIPGRVLMETAGRAVAQRIRERYPQARRFSVLCGPGNNGGDGLVVARCLPGARVFLSAGAEKFKGDAEANLKTLTHLGQSFEELSAHFTQTDVIVDALFGTGLSRPIEGALARAIARANDSGAPIVAVDIPSGIDSATGQLLGEAINADLTVTFGLPKCGHLLYPGKTNCGQLVVEDIGFPTVLTQAARGEWLTQARIAALLPARPPSSHKGTCGRALLLAGSHAYPGAAMLCTSGCLKIGAGLVYVALPEELKALVLGHTPEAIVVERASLSAEGMQVVCVGPGLSEHEGLQSLLESLTVPVVIDADALKLVPAMQPGPARVLTPHPGEMGRLLGRQTRELELDRVGTACEAARRFQAVVVFKGNPTVVADPTGRYGINSSGGPVLSQGGMGDVLAGAITGLIAQGMSPLEAAWAGVYLHGRAGDLCAAALGPRGVGAHQVAEHLPAAYL